MGSGGEVKIIVAGLPRTGTLSMKMALEKLGFGACHHLLTPLFQSVWSTRVRESAMAMATEDAALRQFYLRKRFQGYDAVLDLPGSACVDDLIQMYPDAKVILTLRRNADVWLDSFLGMGIDPRSPIFRLIGFWAPTVTDSGNMMSAWANLCQRRFPTISKVPCIELYDEHANWIRSMVPKERLLEFEPSMGWEPLCGFLGKDIPDTGYPRSNDRNVIRNFKFVAMGIGLLGWIVMFMLLSFCLKERWAVPVWLEHRICAIEYIQFPEGSI